MFSANLRRSCLLLATLVTCPCQPVRAQAPGEAIVELTLGVAPRLEAGGEVQVPAFGPLALGIAAQRWSDSDEVVSVPQKLDHEGTSVTLSLAAGMLIGRFRAFLQAEVGRHYFSDGLRTLVFGGRYGVRRMVAPRVGVVVAARHHRLSSFDYPDPFGDSRSLEYASRWLHSAQVGLLVGLF